MAAFVVALQVQGRRCLVLGGGAEAADKSRRLALAGARVTVISRTLDPPLQEARSRAEFAWIPREFDPELDLADPPFVVISTRLDEAFNEGVRAACRACGALLCCVDAPAQCDFFHTAQGECGPLTLAVASQGRAPMLARRVRDELVRQLDVPLRTLGDALVRLRASLPREERRAGLTAALDGFALSVRVKLPKSAGDDAP